MPETTSNGFEITDPTEKIDAAAFKARMAAEFGIDGDSATERAVQLQGLSNEGIAIMLEDINKSVQGSAGSLMRHESAMKIGEISTIAPEDRYDVFTKLVDAIKQLPGDVAPARIGDVLALGTVLLHPFEDGNGRTARVIGLLFRDNYDQPDFESDFKVVTEARDDARKRGGFMIYGYTPNFPSGFDQSDPAQVSGFLDDLLHDDAQGAYVGPFGQAPLHTPGERL